MMDWEDIYNNSDDDDDDRWNLTKAVSTIRERDTGITRSSVRGLQMALIEGWLVQRARDMCSFTHDRYRQAAQACVEGLPAGSVATMSFRIVLMMLRESTVDVYRISEHAKR